MLNVKPLLSGSRFFFWAIVPIGALLIVPLTFMATGKQLLWAWVFDAVFFLFALGLWDPYRYRFTFRILAALIASLCCVYLWDAARGRSKIWEACAAAIFFGYPSLRFALLGRNSWRKDDDDEWLDLMSNARDASLIMDLLNKTRMATSQIGIVTSLKTLMSAEVVNAMRNGPNANLPSELNKWARRTAMSGQGN